MKPAKYTFTIKFPDKMVEGVLVDKEVQLPCVGFPDRIDGSKVLIYLPPAPPIINADCYEWVESSQVTYDDPT